MLLVVHGEGMEFPECISCYLMADNFAKLIFTKIDGEKSSLVPRVVFRPSDAVMNRKWIEKCMLLYGPDFS